jgi:uncharacterized protein (DUF1015 family)
MSTIQPFLAIRYATAERDCDISTRLAPPYDVLDQGGKDALLARDPKNFVKIDLPHMPPKSAGPPAAYAAAHNTLRQWLQDGTMVRDRRPQIYVYHQKYRHAGTEYLRKMFFARLRLEPFGTGSVFPHERTFGGPKEDRLALTQATQANLSPIFGLYEDAANEVSRRLERGLPDRPLAKGTLEGVESYLWGADDPDRIAAVAELMKPKAIYIADGHHRYGTGLLYRDWLVQQRGPLPDNHPANYVLCVFCAMEDPGLLILPTHRVLPGVKIGDSVLAGDSKLELQPLATASPEEAVQSLARFGPQAVGWFDAASGRHSVVRPRSPDILDSLEPGRSPAWRRLGLAFLHAYLLDRVVTPKLCGGKEPTIQYIKTAADALRAAGDGQGTAFLLQPTTMEELRGVCGAGDLMPQKSTYFFPKLASGLVINPLSE